MCEIKGNSEKAKSILPFFKRKITPFKEKRKNLNSMKLHNGSHQSLEVALKNLNFSFQITKFESSSFLCVFAYLRKCK